LRTANPKLRKAILKHVNPDVIKTLCEISYNTLNGNNKICSKTKKTLAGYKRHLRTLSSSKHSVSAKRKILMQKGGFVPALIGSVLSGLLGAYLNK
jgi:hypothetical protein